MCQTTSHVKQGLSVSQRITNLINHEINLVVKEIEISKKARASLNKKINYLLGERLCLVFLVLIWRRLDMVQHRQSVLCQRLQYLQNLSKSHNLGKTAASVPQLLELVQKVQARKARTYVRQYAIRFGSRQNTAPGADDLIEYLKNLKNEPPPDQPPKPP